jgi:hypothetical protein
MRRGRSWRAWAWLGLGWGVGGWVGGNAAISLYTARVSGDLQQPWPRTIGTVTSFRATPWLTWQPPLSSLHLEEVEGRPLSTQAVSQKQEQEDHDAEEKNSRTVLPLWKRTAHRLAEFIVGERYSFDVQFTYTVPDPNTGETVVYVGSSRRDPNFPTSLDLRCPACVIQAAAIQYYFGREGQQFDLFYHPSPPSIPFITTRQKLDPPPSQNNNTQNNNRDQNRNTFVKFGREGIVPLYTMDPGYVPPESYERLMIGLSSFGLGSLALSKNWSKNMFMERGSSPWRVLIPMVGVVAVAVAATFLTSLAINSSIRAPQASEEEDKPNTK